MLSDISSDSASFGSCNLEKVEVRKGKKKKRKKGKHDKEEETDIGRVSNRKSHPAARAQTSESEAAGHRTQRQERQN